MVGYNSKIGVPNYKYLVSKKWHSRSQKVAIKSLMKLTPVLVFLKDHQVGQLVNMPRNSMVNQFLFFFSSESLSSFMKNMTGYITDKTLRNYISNDRAG